MKQRKPKTEEQKKRERDRMRQKRLDPAFRLAEAQRQHRWFLRHKKIHRERVNASRRKRLRDKIYHAKHKEERREKYRALRVKLFAGYGGKCFCCGEACHDFLELDHVNGGGAKHYRTIPPVNIYKAIIKAGFPSEYQVLCANCNRGRQRAGGICPHKQYTEDS